MGSRTSGAQSQVPGGLHDRVSLLLILNHILGSIWNSYEIYTFREGDFELQGDGGYQNVSPNTNAPLLNYHRRSGLMVVKSSKAVPSRRNLPCMSLLLSSSTTQSNAQSSGVSADAEGSASAAVKGTGEKAAKDAGKQAEEQLKAEKGNKSSQKKR